MSNVVKFYYTRPLEITSVAYNAVYDAIFAKIPKISTRYTFAAVYDDESKEIRFGMAKCNVKDNFCKAVGREIATRNADDKPFHVIKDFNGRRNDYADQVMQIMKNAEIKYLKREYPAFFNKLNNMDNYDRSNI